MAEIGKYNTLNVVKLTDFGAYLDASELGEVLLPKRYVPEGIAETDPVKVFIYFDSNDRLVATTETPKGEVDDFVSLKCIQVNKMGAFLDWGLSKDLLVPYNQQKPKMQVGKYYLVRIYRDHYTDRIAATAKIDKYLDVWPANYQLGEKVSLIIANRTDLGVKAIINQRHWGLIFSSDIFQSLRPGMTVDGYIKNIRQDGRIDLTLTRSGMGKINDFQPQFLAYLKANDGFSSIHDKSSPELIQQTFGVSKKTLKSTIGTFLKNGQVRIEGDGVRLLDEHAKANKKAKATAAKKRSRSPQSQRQTGGSDSADKGALNNNRASKK
ncbi:S1-like domain-containing RNA-binding protein [Thalassotalea ponticola]|uniref:CvfB family protein n=1 Tax=Thalassotalea ponticola TaxID=1523392 RepID=UPI0025B48CFF|nr:S1-like domain-containing RNA-binding protein [Thalassotalea ponticola]MDN3653371.1 S1-like domain-containing RNA-binding protein [Thalassotalea ponticola]